MAESLVDKINRLRKERKAVILAHNYQLPEIQDIADYVGDSLGLSLQALKTEAEIIVFCGVYFMAETAKLISPDKKVIMPDVHAGCPMAEMITAGKLQALKSQNPNAKVVCYVNSGADIKAESDICCTSANAIKIVRSLEAEEIIFVPDKFLGSFVADQAPEKKIVLWHGFCPTHANILPEHLLAAKKRHPQAKVMVHPECRPETIALADAALSTEGMIGYAKGLKETELIVGTEVGMIHRLKKEVPGKMFFPAYDKAVCPNMKLTTLEKLLWSLEELKTEVKVEQNIATKAKLAIEKMLAVGRED